MTDDTPPVDTESVTLKSQLIAHWVTNGTDIDTMSYEELADDVAKCASGYYEAKLKDLRLEIDRHHKDFQRWEGMAAKGARQVENLSLAIDALEEIAGDLELLGSNPYMQLDCVVEIAAEALTKIRGEK